MLNIPDLDPEFHPFLDRALEARQRLGEQAVLLLVGSRAAGFAGPGSDFDLWLLGDAAALAPDERHRYAAEGTLFVDRGDMRAHWEFFDLGDLSAQLAQWPDEPNWILSTAHFLDGDRATFVRLAEQFSAYPRPIARRKLQWLVGRCRALFSAFPKTDASKPLAGVLVCGQLVDCLAKICCVAECRPFPYTKWLTRVARDTHLGATVYPAMEATLTALQERLLLPVATLAPDWPPRKALMHAFSLAREGLAHLGWRESWIDDPWQAVGATHSRPTP